MVKLIEKPTVVPAAGNPPKTIEEFIGRVNSGNERVSVARMTSPEGWVEPAQSPEFDEYTIVVKGELHIKTKTENFVVKAGQAIEVQGGQWVQYSTPSPGGAEYIAVCQPAFSPETVHRDED